MFEELNTLRPFFEEPSKERNVREVARLLHIAPATASTKLKRLSKQGVLKEIQQRIYTFYKANLDNELYRDLKVWYLTRKIKDSRLIEELNKTYFKPPIILFGSAAYGLDTETSDIDVCIISEKSEKFSHLDIYEKKLNRRIQIVLFPSIKKISNKHLLNNIVNGHIIQGEIQWI